MGSIEPFFEVFLDLGRTLVFFVLRETARLVLLETGHRTVKFLVCSYEFRLGFHVSIYILWVNLS